MKQIIKQLLNWLWTFSQAQPQPQPPTDPHHEPIIDEPDIDHAPEQSCQDGCITDNIQPITKPVEERVEEIIHNTNQQNVRFVTAAGHNHQTDGKRSPEKEDGTRFMEWDSNFQFNNNITKTGQQRGLRLYNLTPFNHLRNYSLRERVRDFNKLIDKTQTVPTLGIEIHSNAGPTHDPDNWIDHRIKGIETWYYHQSPIGEWAARIFQKHLIAATGAKNRGIKSRPKEQFYWLRKTKSPCVLLEINFFNNFDDLQTLESIAYRNKVEKAIIAAMLEINEKGFPAPQLSYAAAAPKKSLIGKDIRAESNTGEIIQGVVIEESETQIIIIDKAGEPQIIETINYIIKIAPTLIMLLQTFTDLIKSWFGNAEKKAARQARRAARKLY